MIIIDEVKQSDFSDEEQTEMSNIISVLLRAEEAMKNMNRMVGNKEESKLAKSLAKAHEICHEIRIGRESREKLRDVMETLNCAKNTIEMTNSVLESSIDSYFTNDIRTAWFNSFRIMKRQTDYKKYL